MLLRLDRRKLGEQDKKWVQSTRPDSKIILEYRRFVQSYFSALMIQKNEGKTRSVHEKSTVGFF